MKQLLIESYQKSSVLSTMMQDIETMIPPKYQTADEACLIKFYQSK